MHLKRDGHEHGPPIVHVKFVLEDSAGLTGTDRTEWDLMGGEGESLLEIAIDHGINIEHACGAVCACSTCHVYVEKGMDQLKRKKIELRKRLVFSAIVALRANAKLREQVLSSFGFQRGTEMR